MKGRLFMSNIYTGYGSSPSLYSMFDPSKGSFGNRVDCTTHRMTNSARAIAEESLLGVATYAGYKAINCAAKGKCFNWNTSINKALIKGADLYKNAAESLANASKSSKGIVKYLAKGYKGLANILKSGCEKLAKTSGRQKMLGLLGLAAITTLVAIERKHAFKEGQYDERYNIKAKICENRDI
jgi:hypothetical protein